MYAFGIGKPVFRFWLGAPGEVPPEPPVKPRPEVGRGSGPTTGIKPWKRKREPYRGEYEDVLRETREARIKQDDQDIIDLITTLITKGIL